MEQPVDETRPVTEDDVPDEKKPQEADTDVQDIDMDPEDHVSRPDQPDFDPAERRPYLDPKPEELPPGVDLPEDQ